MSIVVSVDFSTVSKSLINTVVDIANPKDVIHLLHVIEPNPEFVGFEVGPASVNQQIEQELQQKQNKMHQYALLLEQQGYTVKQMQLDGVTADEIIAYASQVKAKMIMLGRHGHSAIYNILVGSVAEIVLKRSPIPVLLVPK